MWTLTRWRNHSLIVSAAAATGNALGLYSTDTSARVCGGVWRAVFGVGVCVHGLWSPLVVKGTK